MKASFIYFPPHIDDVVLSCGGFLRKHSEKVQLIVNIFTRKYNGLTKWDLLCKIRKTPILVRKKESQKALKWIKAKEIYLNFFDNAVFKNLKHTKRPSSDFLEIKNCLFKIINKNISSLEAVFFPLGISHPDHILIAKIGMEIFNQLREKKVQFYFYEDFPFLCNFPTRGTFFWKNFTPIYVPIDEEIFVKIKMVMAYKSQLFPLLQILFPHLKSSEKVNIDSERLWKEFLLSYHGGLAEKGEVRNAKFCERFWLPKNKFL
jgi:LmbE family N-acetylglucosaminyl deacetylase